VTCQRHNVYAGLVALFLARLARRHPSDAQRTTRLLRPRTAHLWLRWRRHRHNQRRLPRQRHMLQNFCLASSHPSLAVSLGLKWCRLVACLAFAPSPSPSGSVIAGLVMSCGTPPLTTPLSLRNRSMLIEHLMHRERRCVLADPRCTSAQPAADCGAAPIHAVATAAETPSPSCHLFARPFYEYYAHAPRLVPSLTPLIDQTVAPS